MRIARAAFGGFAVLTALSAAVGAQPALDAAAAPPESLVVQYDDGRLSVRAEHVSVGRVLEEIASRSGLRLSGVTSLAQDVWVTFTDEPLLDGIRRLLRTASYLLVVEYSPGGTIERIDGWLAGQGRMPGGEQALVPPALS